MSATSSAAGCPFQAGRDDRKSAAIAAKNTKLEPDSKLVDRFNFAREILRSPDMRQGGAGADQIPVDNPEHISFFFLDGDLHRRRRAAIANFFAPKTIVSRYHAVIHRTMDMLIEKLRATGSAELDQLSFQMAVDVVAEIVGLTNSDKTQLARRVRDVLQSTVLTRRKGRLGQILQKAISAYYVMLFFQFDLLPAIKARKIEPKEDVISYMIKEGYSKQGMIIECLSYGAAGMMTTREFIVMVAWHLFTNEALKTRYLNGSEEEQFAILEEILRLEPVAAVIYRRAAKDIAHSAGGPLHENDLFAIDIRKSNFDEAITGECPFALDPDRAKRMKVIGSYMSFGDGPHRCPGSQVALHETRIFIDRLLRVPGITLAQEPKLTWIDAIGSYELRGGLVSCDRA
jgi:cytochrome P450